MSWRQSVGGSWAVSWQAWVFLAVASAIMVAANGPGSFTAWLAIAAATATAIGVVFVIAHLTVLRHRALRPVPVATVAAVGVVAGIARGTVAVVVANALDEELIRPWPVVVFVSGFIVGLATLGLALVLDHVSRTRELHAALRARLADLREQDADRGELATAMTHVATAEVLAAVDEARRGLDVPVGEMTAADRAAMASSVRAVVDDTLRPLSHRLHASADSPPDEGMSRGIHWTGVRTLPVFPVTTGLVVGVVAIPLSQVALGPLAFAVATWAALALAVGIGRWLSWPQHRVAPLALLFVVLAPGASGLVASALTDNASDVVAFVAGAAISFTTTLVVSAIGSVLRGEDDANARLLEAVTAREVDALVADREIARASRDLAQHLHGTLQSRLLAVAFALDEAASRDDEVAFRRALTEARLALEQAGRPPEPDAEDDLPTALATVASLWRGFVEVDVRVAPDLPDPAPSMVAHITRIAEEAVGNAHKHGNARRVQIDVRSAASAVEMRVSDDGPGPVAGVPGMGSAWLDFVAPGAWALRPGDDGSGTVLEVRLVTARRDQPAPGVTA